MTFIVSREDYFETGLAVLSDVGYAGLKLVEVCDRLGVTTGSFYHYFANWPAYTRELVAHWMEASTLKLVELARAEPNPRRRIGNLMRVGAMLPHGAEGAIRSWSSVDPDVRAVQIQVDRQRFDILYESALQILGHQRQAQLFADWAVYLLVGYEQATLPRDAEALAWIVDQLLDTLDSGRFASVPAMASTPARPKDRRRITR